MDYVYLINALWKYSYISNEYTIGRRSVSNVTTFDARIDLLTRYDGNLSNVVTLLPLLEGFPDINNSHKAIILAQTLLNKLGNIAICRHMSIQFNKPITFIEFVSIIRTIIMLEASNGGFQLPQLYYGLKHLEEAMDIVGFKKACECEPIDLLYDFTQSAKFGHKVIDIEFGIVYDYKTIKQKRQQLNDSIMAYIYHPDRVLMWLLNNPDKHVEDYMNY